MTAAALIDSLRDAGIRLTVAGDRLHIEAPTGRFTSRLRAHLVEHKQAVMGLLTMRDRLLAIARTAGVPERIVTALPASELQACIDQIPGRVSEYDDPSEPLLARMLVFYMRELAKMEPVTDGPTAELSRDQTHPSRCNPQLNHQGDSDACP